MSFTSIRLHEWQGRISAERIWHRAGMAGFVFFFIKGLLWLLAPLAWYLIS